MEENIVSPTNIGCNSKRYIFANDGGKEEIRKKPSIAGVLNLLMLKHPRFAPQPTNMCYDPNDLTDITLILENNGYKIGVNNVDNDKSLTWICSSGCNIIITTCGIGSSMSVRIKTLAPTYSLIWTANFRPDKQLNNINMNFLNNLYAEDVVKMVEAAMNGTLI